MRDYLDMSAKAARLREQQGRLAAKQRELGKSTEFKCRFAELTTFSNCPKAPVKLDFGPRGNRAGKRPTEKRPTGKPGEEGKRSGAHGYGSLPDPGTPTHALQSSTHHTLDSGSRQPSGMRLPLPALTGTLQASTSLGRYQQSPSPSLDYDPLQYHSASRPKYGRAPFNRSVDQHPARAGPALHSTFSQLTYGARSKQKEGRQLAKYLQSGPMPLSTDAGHMASYLHTQASSRYQDHLGTGASPKFTGQAGMPSAGYDLQNSLRTALPPVKHAPTRLLGISGRQSGESYPEHPGSDEPGHERQAFLLHDRSGNASSKLPSTIFSVDSIHGVLFR